MKTLALLFLGAGWILAQIPDALKPPASETLVLKALGRGKQIYECRGAAGKFEWVLERPQADLLDSQGRILGRHFEGPTWQAADGSRVVGEVQQHANAPHAGAIPWLLLKAKSHEGTGTFARVTYVQRLNTVGGAVAPEGCDAGHAGKEIAVEYQADYYFYSAH
jgi:hypothetical protein